MYNNRTNYILVGCFVIAMIVAAAGSVAVLTGRTGPTDRYFLSLDNVADIKFGTQVRFEGFPVGQVEREEIPVRGSCFVIRTPPCTTTEPTTYSSAASSSR